MRWMGGFFAICALFLVLHHVAAGAAEAERRYLGSKACQQCHDEQYSNFTKWAKKAKSDHSVKVMAKKLTSEELKECYTCHTTGYGRPGGFKSYEETPDLGHAGCEVCHGPGSAHADSGGEKKLINRRMSMKECETCHNESRVKSFNFKPLLFGGAH